MKRFNSICIITQDIQKLCKFYQEVLQLEPNGDEIFATFPTEGAVLSIFTEQGMEEMAPNSMTDAGYGGNALEFEVDDVDEEYNRLAKLGIPIIKPPTTQPWGLRSVWFRDPDGNIVNFYANNTHTEKTPDVKVLVHQYFQRLLNEKDLSVCDEMLSNEYIDHDSPSSISPGSQSIKDFVRGFIEDYPDIRVEVVDIIAENNKVAARLMWRGHHRETGEIFHQAGIIFLRLNDRNQMVERWSAYKSLE
jgi:catechol 2,3-dioxygenase-like lactoylglutathione lyase family enzyme/predicted SnoaL-like aldol condensation-catalyzing enzyme